MCDAGKSRFCGPVKMLTICDDVDNAVPLVKELLWADAVGRVDEDSIV